MKVLVADDNVAIQEILREIVTNTGNQVFLASSVSETADSILDNRPDLIFLDMYLGGEPGMKAIDIVHEEDVAMNMKVYILKNSKEFIPKDEAFVVGVIEKPFRSADIIDILSGTKIAPESEPQQAPRPSRREKRRKSKDTQAAEEQTGLPSGSAHLILEGSPAGVYKYASDFADAGYNMLIITSNKIKAVREKMKYGKMNVIALSAKPRLDYKDIRALGSLTESVNSFIAESARPVIVVDGLSALIEKNGINRTLTFIRQLTAKNAGAATFLISLNENSIDKKGLDILVHNMEIHKTVD
ncbi:MAG: DUF835 domain-containing protein [Candidatus Methanomethylophilaceae archaeon]|jgi:CheY-like chemotaxis protein|nr:DUF835 domain-containing protein [Candidatus Methanomethylophilaceae archaeon]MDD3351091.1 DUF835 domain-containing protein [Candidatus Methanomethylophilaceae archaeon]MDD3986308.1 DUF835 domain-containing protein [Candidatus Methanomethylophilaceae archaeon]MDD4708698.1 DUF835 domain-containing protein [Candidatus Methanomethylophilaceae archaeon]NCA73963.1 DUF835 domain-containing protein [Gammaproteobacteria bacterium]